VRCFFYLCVRVTLCYGGGGGGGGGWVMIWPPPLLRTQGCERTLSDLFEANKVLSLERTEAQREKDRVAKDAAKAKTAFMVQDCFLLLR